MYCDVLCLRSQLFLLDRDCKEDISQLFFKILNFKFSPITSHVVDINLPVKEQMQDFESLVTSSRRNGIINLFIKDR